MRLLLAVAVGLLSSSLALGASRREARGLEMAGVSFPKTEKAKKQVIASDSYTISNGVKSISGPLKYTTLARTGDKTNKKSKYSFGQVMNLDMMPVQEVNGDATATIPGEHISNYCDFTSLLGPYGPNNDELRSLVHFESPQPASMGFLKIKQKADGHLDVHSIEPVDWTSFDGLWNPCAGSVSPWGTHLGSEEYEPDARVIDESTTITQYRTRSDTGDSISVISYMRYYNFYPENVTMADIKTHFKPYRYGYVTEVVLDYTGEVASVHKRYAMGRVSVELGLVAPDNKTVFMSDDGTNRVILMFKMDNLNDLTSGTLYALKAHQLNAYGGGQFDITWISLGHATEAEIAPLVGTTKFSDIFDSAAPITLPGGTKGCPVGFTSINSGQGFQSSIECLTVKPGMEKAASRMETRRYAAYLGATTEFSKVEGTTIHPGRMRMYTSMSQVRYGMEDYKKNGNPSSTYDVGGPNDVRLEYNPCGCVYQFSLDANYTPYFMEPLICGKYNLTNVDSNNQCDKNSISEPDNVRVLPEYDALIIGEDTSLHQNDAVWLFDLADKRLTRILTTPYGSESTSVYWYPNINKHGYMIANVQHPYTESDQDKLNPKRPGAMDGYVGYLGPFTDPANM